MKSKILCIDDEPINLQALHLILKDKYDVIVTTNGSEAISIIQKQRPDIILMDILMPNINGYEILEIIKNDVYMSGIPVIFITSLDSVLDEEEALKKGAVDFLTKPVNRAVVLARVKNHLELKKYRDILKDRNKFLEEEVEKKVHENLILQEASLSALVGLAETRDSDTGDHIIRTSFYCGEILKNLPQEILLANNINKKSIKTICKASQLHDIGKIGIPDHILLKPGALDQDEFETMKNHCIIGSNAIKNSIDLAYKRLEGDFGVYHASSLDFLETAMIIAEFHHEKWDGSGYPHGLKGQEIPFSARIMAIADVFDALTNKRVYKEAFSTKDAIEYMNTQDEIHFDPDLMECFNKSIKGFLDIFNKYRDRI